MLIKQNLATAFVINLCFPRECTVIIMLYTQTLMAIAGVGFTRLLFPCHLNCQVISINYSNVGPMTLSWEALALSTKGQCLPVHTPWYTYAHTHKLNVLHVLHLPVTQSISAKILREQLFSGLSPVYLGAESTSNAVREPVLIRFPAPVLRTQEVLVDLAMLWISIWTSSGDSRVQELCLPTCLSRT